MSVPHRALPCFPCPHQSACCQYGATVSEREAREIEAEHGPGKIKLLRGGELRTRVKNGYCVFHQDNVCTIHGKPYYPEVCRCFPWTDAETGGPYQYDQTICPEFKTIP